MQLRQRPRQVVARDGRLRVQGRAGAQQIDGLVPHGQPACVHDRHPVRERGVLWDRVRGPVPDRLTGRLSRPVSVPAQQLWPGRRSRQLRRLHTLRWRQLRAAGWVVRLLVLSAQRRDVGAADQFVCVPRRSAALCRWKNVCHLQRRDLRHWINVRVGRLRPSGHVHHAKPMHGCRRRRQRRRVQVRRGAVRCWRRAALL